MQVWVVTREGAWAGYWALEGVHSSPERARAWVEARWASAAERPRWTVARAGAVWLCDDYCVYRMTVDGDPDAQQPAPST